MTGTINKVILIGYLGRNPEMRTTQNGKTIASFSLATSNSWNDKTSGEKVKNVQWHRIVIMNENLSEIANKYLKKGSKVYIEGELSTREWNDGKVKRYITEIILKTYNSKLIFLEALHDSQIEKINPSHKNVIHDNIDYDDLNDEIPF